MPLLLEEQLQVFRLGIVHPFVVNLRQRIQFLAQGFEASTLLLVGQWR